MDTLKKSTGNSFALKLSAMKHILIVLLFWMIASSVCAQKGSIAGKVVDATTGEELSGVVVQIVALGVGAQTDLYGAYEIKNVVAGTHEVTIDFISYETKKITGVTVEDGKETKLDVPLSNVSDETGTVTITEFRATNTEASVLMEMKDAKGVMSGMSGAQIAKSQDRNASEVARRIPGVTVIDNRFVMVRGLTERYNSVMMNGIMVPSLEADVRSFSFDLIPSIAIDRFLIYKSPSADLPGEFAGGAINVMTKNFPDNKMSLDVNVGLGYRQGTTGKNFMTNTNSSTEKFGFDDGARALPEGFPQSVRDVTDPDELTALGKTLPNTWAIEEANAPLDVRSNVSFGKRFAFKELMIGNITTLSYSNTRTFLEAYRLDYNVYDETQGRSDTVFTFKDNVYQKNTNLGGLHNWGLKYKNHSLDFKNFFNQTGLQSNTARTGRAIEEGNFRKEYSFNYNQRSIYTGQLSGKHELFAKRGTLNWAMGYGMSRRQDPDWKRIRYTSPMDGSDPAYHAYVPFGAQPFYLGRLYLRLNEDIRTYTASYQHNIIKTGVKDEEDTYLSVKVGAYYEDKDRVFTARNIGYAQANTFQFNYALDLLPIDQILAPENLNSTTGFKIDEDTKGSDSYSASNNLLATYGMVEIPKGKWNVTAGVRLENSKQRLNSYTLTGNPLAVKLDTVALLPSVNVSYNITDKMLVRAAFGRTLNRPEFREMAPYSFYDFEQNFIINGNPNVKVAEINNYDLRWEIYPKPTEVFSVSLFYKEFKNPLEMYFAPGVGSGGTRSFTPGNALSAVSYGAEIDLRKSLFGMTRSKVVDNFSLVANASIIKSTIELSPENLETDLNSKRPMMGQSPYIINGGVYYQDDSLGLQISALYNVIGPRIAIVGIPGNPEVYEMERHMIDISVTKNVGEHFSVRLGLQDLLNQDFIFLQDANNDGELSKDNDQRLRFFNRGSYFSFAIQYRFRQK